MIRFFFRAAATRCREKRKIWVQQLEKKADDLSETNAQLQVHAQVIKMLQNVFFSVFLFCFGSSIPSFESARYII